METTKQQTDDAMDRYVHQLRNGRWAIGDHDWQRGEWTAPMDGLEKALNPHCHTYVARTIEGLGVASFPTRAQAEAEARRRWHLGTPGAPQPQEDCYCGEDITSPAARAAHYAEWPAHRPNPA